MKYLETNCTDPCFNLAAEEYLFTRRAGEDWLMLWQNRSAVVVGLNQNAQEEIDRDFVERNNIAVVRRMTGGGAVYHDLGNLNYSIITGLGGGSGHSIARFAQPVCAALGRLGLEAELSGRNDILVSGKKVSGSAERILKGRLLHHGCLLFDSDTQTLSRALSPDPEKFSSKAVRSVAGRVGNILELLPEKISMEQFRTLLREELLGGEAEPTELTAEERETVQRLAEEKYRSWDWTYGRSPDFGFRSRRRFPGGTLDIRLDVREGVIARAAFYGDYMARCPNDGLCRAMTGLRFQRDALSQTLSRFDIPELFGDISAQQILETLFDPG